MSHVYPVTPDHPLCGTWVAMCAEDSSDYPHTEYTISVVEGQFHVSGVDLKIKDTAFQGGVFRG